MIRQIRDLPFNDALIKSSSVSFMKSNRVHMNTKLPYWQVSNRRLIRRELITNIISCFAYWNCDVNGLKIMNFIGLLFLFLWKETLGNHHGFQCNYGQLSLTDVICTCENNVDTSTGTVRIYHEIEYKVSQQVLDS